MLWLCFKLPSCLFGNTRDTSVIIMYEKSKICLFYLYATAKSEIQICSNKHETDHICLLKLMHNIPYLDTANVNAYE